MELWTRTDLAEELGITQKSVSRLVGVGRLPEPTRAGRVTIWNREQVAGVLEAEVATPATPAIMVKLGEAMPAAANELPPIRTQVGWDRNLAAMDPVQIAGIDRWWTVKNAEDWIGKTFIASSIGFVLATYTIEDVHTVQNMRHFILKAPDEEARMYEGKRFPSERGALVKSW